MKDKLIKTYRTAWRWPEAYGESKDLIWTGRVLTIAVPVGLTVLAFVSSLTLYGLVPALLLAAFVALGMVTITVCLFHEEYPTVEEFEIHEDRIKNFFHGFPKYTDIPLIENGDREWVAYGHVDPFKFVTAISTILRDVEDDPDAAEHVLWLEDRVEYHYARFNNPLEDLWNEGITLCTDDTTRCFPITRVKDD